LPNNEDLKLREEEEKSREEERQAIYIKPNIISCISGLATFLYLEHSCVERVFVG
jgi:hypothetical protein